MLDSLLGLNDPEPQEQDFTWDFQWEHPKIDAGVLKQRLQAFGTDAASGPKTDDDSAALALADWLGNETDDMERGLPSLVDAVEPGREAGPVAGLIKRLDALVRKTPVRGIDFEWHYPEEMAAILHSPGAQHLRWMSFANRPAEGRPGPV